MLALRIGSAEADALPIDLAAELIDTLNGQGS